MFGLIILVIWFMYVYVWASLSNKVMLSTQEWPNMKFRHRAARAFFFPSWADHFEDRNWNSLWAYVNDNTAEYEGKDDMFPALKLRTAIANSCKSHTADPRAMTFYKAISIFPMFGLNALIITFCGIFAVAWVSFIEIPTAVRFLYNKAVAGILELETTELFGIFSASNLSPVGKIAAQVRQAKAVAQELEAILETLKVRREKIQKLLEHYTEEERGRKKTQLAVSNFDQTRDLLKGKSSSNYTRQLEVKAKLTDVNEAIVQLGELQTLAVTLQGSEDQDLNQQLDSLLQQADSVTRDAIDLEVLLSFREFINSPEYKVPQIPSAVSSSTDVTT